MWHEDSSHIMREYFKLGPLFINLYHTWGRRYRETIMRSALTFTVKVQESPCSFFVVSQVLPQIAFFVTSDLETQQSSQFP